MSYFTVYLSQSLIHLLNVLHGDVVDVLQVDPVPVPLLHVQLADGASHKVFSAAILRPSEREIAERKTCVCLNAC